MSPSRHLDQASKSIVSLAPSNIFKPAVVSSMQSTLSKESDDWRDMVEQLQISGLARELAQHCELRELNESDCLLRIAPGHGHLQMKPSPEKLQAALCEFIGRSIVVRFETAKTESDTPAVTAGRERRERLERAISSVEQDAFVRDVIETFDASLVESSIKPIQ